MANEPATVKGIAALLAGFGEADLAREIRAIVAPVDTIEVSKAVMAKSGLSMNFDNHVQWVCAKFAMMLPGLRTKTVCYVGADKPALLTVAAACGIFGYAVEAFRWAALRAGDAAPVSMTGAPFADAARCGRTALAKFERDEAPAYAGISLLSPWPDAGIPNRTVALLRTAAAWAWYAATCARAIAAVEACTPVAFGPNASELIGGVAGQLDKLLSATLLAAIGSADPTAKAAAAAATPVRLAVPNIGAALSEDLLTGSQKTTLPGASVTEIIAFAQVGAAAAALLLREKLAPKTNESTWAEWAAATVLERRMADAWIMREGPQSLMHPIAGAQQQHGRTFDGDVDALLASEIGSSGRAGDAAPAYRSAAAAVAAAVHALAGNPESLRAFEPRRAAGTAWDALSTAVASRVRTLAPERQRSEVLPPVKKKKKRAPGPRSAADIVQHQAAMVVQDIDAAGRDAAVPLSVSANDVLPQPGVVRPAIKRYMPGRAGLYGMTEGRIVLSEADAAQLRGVGVPEVDTLTLVKPAIMQPLEPYRFSDGPSGLYVAVYF